MGKVFEVEITASETYFVEAPTEAEAIEIAEELMAEDAPMWDIYAREADVNTLSDYQTVDAEDGESYKPSFLRELAEYLDLADVIDTSVPDPNQGVFGV